MTAPDTKEGWNGSRLSQLRSAKPAPPKDRAPRPYKVVTFHRRHGAIVPKVRGRFEDFRAAQALADRLGGSVA